MLAAHYHERKCRYRGGTRSHVQSTVRIGILQCRCSVSPATSTPMTNASRCFSVGRWLIGSRGVGFRPKWDSCMFFYVRMASKLAMGCISAAVDAREKTGTSPHHNTDTTRPYAGTLITISSHTGALDSILLGRLSVSLNDYICAIYLLRLCLTTQSGLFSYLQGSEL